MAVDHARPQCASAIASVNPMKPIQKSPRRSAPESGAGPAARPPRPSGATMANPMARRRKASVTGPNASTAGRMTT